MSHRGYSSIRLLMDDLNEALNLKPDMLFMGGGNPALIEPVLDAFRGATQKVLDDASIWHSAAAVYADSAGYMPLRKTLAGIFAEHYNWDITESNIFISNGSQSAFQLIFKLYENGNGSLLLPQVPDYIGYADLARNRLSLRGVSALSERLDENQFRYRLDQERIEKSMQGVKLAVLSQPTNPTGGVLPKNDLDFLAELCRQKSCSLLIDQAYGGLFPNIMQKSLKLDFFPEAIYSFSMSKMGFPGGRVGIIVADEEVIDKLADAAAVSSLSPNSIGCAITNKFLSEVNWSKLVQQSVKPYYEANRKLVLDFIHGSTLSKKLRYHEPAGAYFLWVEVTRASSSLELYNRLKDAGLLVVPGSFFFFGFDENGNEIQEPGSYLRLSYAQPKEHLNQCLKVLESVLNS